MSTLLISMLIIVAAFYFMLLRPVLKQQQRQRREIANLQVGDRVLTQAGFLATIAEIRVPEEGPTLITLDFGGGVLVTAVPEAISQRFTPAAATTDQSVETASQRVTEGEA